MTSMLIVIAAVAVLLLAAFAVLFARLARPRTLPVSADWIRELSTSRYRPMERLLDDGDFDFLSGHPGANRKMIHRLRAQRRKVFRSYLRCLARDFDRVCLALEIVMMQSAQDRPDLARAIIRQRAQFRFAMMAVQGRLAMHALGVGHVDVRGLLGAFDSLGSELRMLVPAADIAAA